MRAWEFLEHRQPRSQPMTLRHLNQINLEQKSRDESLQRRLELVRVMYRNTQHRRESLEIERLELELAQLRQEVEAGQDAATYDAIGRMAKSGVDAIKKSEDGLTKLARSGVGRKRKPLS